MAAAAAVIELEVDSDVVAADSGTSRVSAASTARAAVATKEPSSGQLAVVGQSKGAPREAGDDIRSSGELDRFLSSWQPAAASCSALLQLTARGCSCSALVPGRQLRAEQEAAGATEGVRATDAATGGRLVEGSDVASEVTPAFRWRVSQPTSFAQWSWQIVRWRRALDSRFATTWAFEPASLEELGPHRQSSDTSSRW